MTSGRLVVLVVGLGALGCDDREAFREPDPTLARMLVQRRADPYEPSVVFPDGKVMRDPPSGAIARGQTEEPPPVTRELVTSGRDLYERTCAACHGITGDGDSVVATKMEHRPPPSLLRPPHSREQMFAVVTEGYGLMPTYAAMLDARERWAVVAYVQALQVSRRVRVVELPPDVRAELEKEAR